MTKLPTSTAQIALSFLINSSYTVFLTTSVFTTSLSLLKSTGAFFNSEMSNFAIFDFKIAKSTFLANFDVLTLVVSFKSAYMAYLDKSNSNSTFPP